LPPRSRTLMPTAVASQCVLVTTPNVPSMTGLVVKELAAILPRCHDGIVDVPRFKILSQLLDIDPI
jgi:hypothetical protein